MKHISDRRRGGNPHPPLWMTAFVAAVLIAGGLACNASAQPVDQPTAPPTAVINTPSGGAGGVTDADEVKPPEETTPEPTPRPATLPPPGATVESGKFECPGALAARLTVGEQARVTFSNGLSVRVRERPGTDDSITVLFTMPEGTVFTVIGGPECVDGWVWWEIEMANGVTGWASEGSHELGYFLEPYPPQ